jgi:hypothetical protein
MQNRHVGTRATNVVRLKAGTANPETHPSQKALKVGHPGELRLALVAREIVGG